MTWKTNLIFTLLVALGLAATGCGRSYNGPPTLPVKGRVMFTDGGDLKALIDRQTGIEFKSVEDPEIRAYGELLEDGSFTLSTVKDRQSQPGAIAGEHQVRLFIDDSTERFVSPRFGKFETSSLVVKVPSDNEIVIKVCQ